MLDVMLLFMCQYVGVIAFILFVMKVLEWFDGPPGGRA